MLQPTQQPLVAGHDLVLFDLDGVLYLSGEALPGAVGAVAGVRSAGARVGFVTNNASRTPEHVARRLGVLGIEADASEVVTSAQAAAHLLAQEHAPDSAIRVLGDEGLWEALRREGLQPVDTEGPAPVALVTGYAPQVRWYEIMDAAVLIRGGLPWTACNEDRTIPTSAGLAPGHGTQVRMLADFAGIGPRVAGKPALPLMHESVRRLGGSRPIMVGDRLDTDIAGARAAGMPSLLVLTGVTGLAELVGAPPQDRPTHLAVDLGGLGVAHPVPTRPRDVMTAAGAVGTTSPDPVVTLHGWTARVRHGRVEVSGHGTPDDWWRCVATLVWSHRDNTGAIPAVAGLTPPASENAGTLGS